MDSKLQDFDNLKGVFVKGCFSLCSMNCHLGMIVELNIKRCAIHRDVFLPTSLRTSSSTEPALFATFDVELNEL